MDFPRSPYPHRIFTFNPDNLKLFKKQFIKKPMEKENFFKKPLPAGIIGIIALIGGFYFLGNSMTGRVITEHNLNFSLLSIIGLLLIICSFILIIYSVKKR